MTHITIEREEAKRILHVINSGAGELRQLGLRLAGKTLEQALAAPVQEPLGKLCVFDDADSEFGWSYDISGNAEQHRRLKELDGAMLYTAPPAPVKIGTIGHIDNGKATLTASILSALQATPPAAHVPLTDELSNAVQMACQLSFKDHGRRSVNEQAWQRLMQAVAAFTHGITGKGQP